MTAINAYTSLFDWLERVKRVYRSGGINRIYKKAK